MPEGIGLASPLNDFEARLSRLEQRAPSVERPLVEVTVDPDTGAAVQSNPLDYTVGAWESMPKLTESVTDGVPGGTWSDGAEGLLTPTASRIGNMIFLSGIIKRASGSTGTINANTNQPNTQMFRLPFGWRPSRTVLLLCPCAGASTSAPEATATMGMALLTIKPDLLNSAGLVRLVTTTVALTPGATGGWISLCGGFPGAFTADSPAEPPPGSWNASPPAQTWDQVDPLVTWNSWPNRSG